MPRYLYEKSTKLKDIFNDSFVNGLGLDRSHLNGNEYRKSRHVKRVFAVAIKEIIERCMIDDVKFVGYKNSCEIYIRKKSEVEVDRIIKTGIYKSVDIIESEYNFYEFIFYTRAFKKFAGVRISYRKYQELVGLVNKGKRYSKKKRKNINISDVTKRISGQFPNTPKDKIEIIIREGIDKIRTCVINDWDVMIQHDAIPIKMLIYKPNFAIRKKWASKVKTHLQAA